MKNQNLKKRMFLKTLPLRDALWPVIRHRAEPEILVDTIYPSYGRTIAKIRKDDKDWEIHVASQDESKISSEDIRRYFSTAIRRRVPDSARMKRGLRVDFRLDSVSMSSWRDIFDGRIQELIDDHETGFESSQLGTFGYLKGETKPVRLKFIQLANEHPDKLSYIETGKFTKDKADGNFLTLLDLKRRFKYVIDLPGHGTSTKSYWMAFLKRPMFYIEPGVKFEWEKRLEPWQHYIPVARDLSDLVKNYDWAEANPDKVEAISRSLFEFGMNEIHPDLILDRFGDQVASCCK